MALFKVTCGEDAICGNVATYIIEAKDKSEAKRKAIQKCPFLWDYLKIEQYESEKDEK